MTTRNARRSSGSGSCRSYTATIRTNGRRWARIHTTTGNSKCRTRSYGASRTRCATRSRTGRYWGSRRWAKYGRGRSSRSRTGSTRRSGTSRCRWARTRWSLTTTSTTTRSWRSSCRRSRVYSGWRRTRVCSTTGRRTWARSRNGSSCSRSTRSTDVVGYTFGGSNSGYSVFSRCSSSFYYYYNSCWRF